MKSFYQLSGWIGVALILASYTLLNLQVVKPVTLTYQSINALGAIGIALEAGAKKDYQPFILNLIWLFISLLSMLQLLIHS